MEIMEVKRWDIPQWFISKNLNNAQASILANYESIDIAKETEKALQLFVTSPYGTTFFWIPKSIIIKERENQNKIVEKFEQGVKNYEALIKFAKDNGVKGVRVGLRKATILKKIADAGLVYDEEQEEKKQIMDECKGLTKSELIEKWDNVMRDGSWHLLEYHRAEQFDEDDTEDLKETAEEYFKKAKIIDDIISAMDNND